MKAIRTLKQLRMGALAAGVSAALLVPAPQPAEASILIDAITGVIGAGVAYNNYLGQLLGMGNSPVVQKKLLDQDVAKRGQDESEETRALVDGVMNQLIERGEYALAADSLPFRWSVNADDSFNASCTAADYVSINRGLVTALHGDRDELAGVLAHEMIHGLHQHIAYLREDITLIFRDFKIKMLKYLLYPVRVRFDHPDDIRADLQNAYWCSHKGKLWNSSGSQIQEQNRKLFLRLHLRRRCRKEALYRTEHQ